MFPALSVGDPGKVTKNMFTINPHKRMGGGQSTLENKNDFVSSVFLKKRI